MTMSAGGRVWSVAAATRPHQHKNEHKKSQRRWAIISNCAAIFTKRGQEVRAMTQAEWVERIKSSAVEAGTYRPFFDDVIATLGGILERRDQAQELFVKTKQKVIVKHTNKGGATNIEQNPLLRLINDLNRDALAYWRDLGLTPAGLKRINEEAMKKPKENALAKALKELG